MMRLAEQSGLVQLLARALRPVMRALFPEVPPGHPAMGAMVLNMAANMLGLGNAATPLGLRAMAQLERINPHPGVATNAMCTFLALNTASIQLIPTTVIGLLAVANSQESHGDRADRVSSRLASPRCPAWSRRRSCSACRSSARRAGEPEQRESRRWRRGRRKQPQPGIPPLGRCAAGDPRGVLRGLSGDLRPARVAAELVPAGAGRRAASRSPFARSSRPPSWRCRFCSRFSRSTRRAGGCGCTSNSWKARRRPSAPPSA